MVTCVWEFITDHHHHLLALILFWTAYFSNVVLLGDFNVNFTNPDDFLYNKIEELKESFVLNQLHFCSQLKIDAYHFLEPMANKK